MKITNSNITDVFFDLDHTLWDFEKNSALAFETVFKMQDLAINMTEFLQFYVPINREYWERYRKDEISQKQLRFGRLKDTFDLMRFEIEDDLIVTLSEQYIHYLPKFNHLFDGTIEILDYLKAKYSLHIITNGFAEIQENKLNNSYITHYFKTITNSEMAGVKKPNSLIFDYALNLAKAKKENSIMIGDCIEADVQGALDAGLDAVFFNENNVSVPQTIKQVNHLLELKKYL
ncbi:noncanonical pyrimidine nucleotidase, YjjG family [Flavobacterium alvei]|uniref:Noncanonical pyrimidine nucleotidase, YjjG family n=1 Tax=Flavobacterium alvei TaxID=2080416 RepID=A0A2S5AFE5_9FLAO|nr:YjjG family noncanonical pyrimidine nucleotidase [Flavobacterium alvei]POY41280.1 noncanonical pyrimidine nucleotidase, YjjG family [Flavobacterium alvei]HQE33843.1 YjjG family noncanonical pyrimidine nucleotidase [Flavobacterium alvei]HQF47698.1 YjjG family noncanonical pyrimidine nucleotidase [Flavobacterium alvei]HQK40732.1 YjjG family noncanonical pyrimidine nucleotidase [Flavobacterium alvei]